MTDIQIDWFSLSETVLRLVHERMTEDRFRALFGVSSYLCTVIFNIVYPHTSFAALDLLLFLLFAKQYGSETLLSLFFDMNEKSYGNRIWDVVDKLNTFLPDFKMTERFDEEIVGENVISSLRKAHLILDTTSCNIQTPSGGKKLRRKFYSYKKRYQMKYELAVGVRTGRIYWTRGAYPGSFSDSTIVQKSGFLSNLVDGEIVLADTIYNIKKLSGHILAPHKQVPKKQLSSYNLAGLLQRARFNKHIRGRRVVVERTLARLKSFGALKQIWRHQLTLQPKLFNVLCKIVNLDLLYHPLVRSESQPMS